MNTTLIAELNTLSHHAYCLIGGDELHADLLSFLEKKHRMPIHGDPDFFDRSYETFTIDEARELKSLAGMRPVTAGGRRYFILAVKGITVEAQNALLKLLEEPHDYVHFFLIIPSTHLLLSTITSRVHLVGAGKAGAGRPGSGRDMSEAQRFLKSSPAKRLEEVKALLDDVSKEKRPKQDAIDLLNDIEAAVYEERGVKGGRAALEAIDTARKYAHDRAPSLKMLLEYVALNV